jgi:aconitate hydratase
MMHDSTFADKVRAARKPKTLVVGDIARQIYDVSGIPGATELPRALVVLLENVVRNAATD